MKLFCVLVTLLLHNTGGSQPQPRDLADEVQELIATLKAVSSGAASEGTNNILNLIDDSLLRKNNSYTAMEASIDNQWLQYWLSVLKIYEVSVGYDVSSCFTTNEDQLLKLPDRCRNQATICVSQYIRSLDNLSADNVANIAAITNIVDTLAQQVEECEGNLLCLSPLIEEIELMQVQIPQRIGIEVENTAKSIDPIDVGIKRCIDNADDLMVSMGRLCVRAIELCVDKIIGA